MSSFTLSGVPKFKPPKRKAPIRKALDPRVGYFNDLSASCVRGFRQSYSYSANGTSPESVPVSLPAPTRKIRCGAFAEIRSSFSQETSESPSRLFLQRDHEVPSRFSSSPSVELSDGEKSPRQIQSARSHSHSPIFDSQETLFSPPRSASIATVRPCSAPPNSSRRREISESPTLVQSPKAAPATVDANIAASTAVVVRLDDRADGASDPKDTTSLPESQRSQQSEEPMKSKSILQLRKSGKQGGSPTRPPPGTPGGSERFTGHLQVICPTTPLTSSKSLSRPPSATPHRPHSAMRVSTPSSSSRTGGQFPSTQAPATPLRTPATPLTLRQRIKAAATAEASSPLSALGTPQSRKPRCSSPTKRHLASFSEVARCAVSDELVNSFENMPPTLPRRRPRQELRQVIDSLLDEVGKEIDVATDTQKTSLSRRRGVTKPLLVTPDTAPAQDFTPVDSVKVPAGPMHAPLTAPAGSKAPVLLHADDLASQMQTLKEDMDTPDATVEVTLPVTNTRARISSFLVDPEVAAELERLRMSFPEGQSAAKTLRMLKIALEPNAKVFLGDASGIGMNFKRKHVQELQKVTGLSVEELGSLCTAFFKVAECSAVHRITPLLFARQLQWCPCTRRCDAHFKRLFEIFDVQHNGELSNTDFLVGMAKLTRLRQNLSSSDTVDWTFRFYDINDNGYITFHDFLKLCTIPSDDVYQMVLLLKTVMSLFNPSNTGRITPQEFAEAAKHQPLLFDVMVALVPQPAFFTPVDMSAAAARRRRASIVTGGGGGGGGQSGGDMSWTNIDFDWDALVVMWRDFQQYSNNGEINKIQFRQILRSAFGFQDVLLMDRYFQAMDESGNGLLDFGELLAGLTVIFHGSVTDTLTFLFKTFDVDDSGCLSKQELWDLLFYKSPNGVLDDDWFQRMYTEMGPDRKNGTISLQSFIFVATRQRDLLDLLFQS